MPEGPWNPVEANNYLYLLDFEAKRIGTICEGKDFITFSTKYQKRL